MSPARTEVGRRAARSLTLGLAGVVLLSCTESHTSTPCTTSSACAAIGQVCESSAMRCVECITDADCVARGVARACFASACTGRPLLVGPDADLRDAPPLDAGPTPPTDEVDLLLAIDNSNSMVGEQTLLGRELPRLVRVLVSGDADEDGLADFRAVRSLHVGVVTSDMGAGPAVPEGETVPSCENGFGDDGILRSVGVTSMAGCAATYPAIFDFAPPDDPLAFATDLACVALMGSGGCGFEQQLEAMLKAVSAASPSADYVPEGYIPPVFAGNTPGHGDNVNAGFVRRDSVLAILVLTDEEDCSVPDYSLFYRDARFTSVGFGLRCFTFAADWLFPTQRYADNLLQLRARPSRLVFAGLVGVPTDIVGSTVADFDRMLADPRVIETPDTSTMPPTRLLGSCDTADGGMAFPPRRTVSVARDLRRLGARATIQSICAADFRPGVDAFLEETALALEGG